MTNRKPTEILNIWALQFLIVVFSCSFIFGKNSNNERYYQQKSNPLPRSQKVENSDILKIKFVDFTLPQNCTIKLNVFVNGGDLATLTTVNVAKGASEVLVSYKKLQNGFNGIGELVIGSIGAFPIILGDTIQEYTVGKEELKNYFPPALNNNLKALDAFLKVYRSYEMMISNYQSKLISPFGMYTSNQNVYKEMLGDYVSFRNQFNVLFKYCEVHFPDTYVANVLSKIFVQQAQIKSWSDVRVSYFKNWDFSESNILNNPIFNRQIDIYNLICDIPSIKDEKVTLDELYSKLKSQKNTSKLVFDHITSKTLVSLFQQNNTGQKDQVIAHLYNNWLINDQESCNEEANENELYQKAFLKRLGNISKVSIGAILPSVSGQDLNGKLVSTDDFLKRNGSEAYLLLFIWSSSCTHCEEYAPFLQEFAQLNGNNLQVVAYSMDKKKSENDWKRISYKRSQLKNWVDIAELNDVQSTGLSQICYMGTPTVFLMDQSGKILSKSTDIKILNSLINSSNTKTN